MANFEIKGYNSYSGCDIIVTARLNAISGANKDISGKIYTLGSLQTLSVSTHQDKKPVRVIGSANALDYTLGQRTVAGSLVFAVFDQHFATEMFNDLEESTGKTFFLPDELPALDITITFANEYGKKSRMAIYGLRIINEGQVMSINDLYTENTYQFVANSMEPLKKGVQTGQDSSVNTRNKIVSTMSTNNDSNSNKGEEIYNKNLVTNFISFKRVGINVEVEQPKTKEQDGIVKITLSPHQSVGIISILNRRKNKTIKEIQVMDSIKNYTVFLPPGDYSAWYSDKGQTMSNTFNFNVNNVALFESSINDIPVIENVTANSIKALCNNPAHTIGVCINTLDNSKQEVELNSRIALFKNLKPKTKYLVYTRNDVPINSKAINVTTLNENNSFVNNFKDYVKYNSVLLSHGFEDYAPILDSLNTNNFLTELNEKDDIKNKELLYMGVKYNNEHTATINEDNNAIMAKKNIDNMFGNTFTFNEGVAKANVFISKNNKDYYEGSELYPTEVTYIGKPNTIYNVTGINNNYVKSPKYMFYSFSDNDKAALHNVFGNVNMLNKCDIKYPTNLRLSNLGYKCLAAKENKNKDMDVLRAPGSFIDKDLNLIVDVKYSDVLGWKNNDYYLCVSRLNESLDSTPFRKIKILDSDDYILVNKYLTAINKSDVFVLWIEDAYYNVISDLGFVSTLEDTEYVNDYLIKQRIEMVTKKIENGINKPGYLMDIPSLIDDETLYEKNIYEEIAKQFIASRIDYFVLIYELYKTIFSEVCINRELYKKVTYDKKNQSVVFDAPIDSEIIQIGIKKDIFTVQHINSNKANINNEYDINIFYIINANPVIKSGFVIFDKYNKEKAYSINLEVIDNG